MDKKTNKSDLIAGGLADKHTPESIAMMHNVNISQIFSQLAKGLKVELEHTNDENIAKEIAMDHLVEDPAYYDKLEKVEEESATLDATPGMGEPSLPARGELGSGDVPNLSKKKKKKIKGFDEFLNNK